MHWKYESDQRPKRKHHWSRNEAGFVVVDGHRVGKCPQKLSSARAEELVNKGFQYFPFRWTKAYPSRIYVVDDGVLYRAVPTNPGVSYHGFPEDPAAFQELPAETRKQILEHARDLGQLEEVRKWLAV